MSELTIQGIGITALAQTYGTPLFVYDGDVLRRQFQQLRDVLDTRVEMFYSLKANPNVSICALLHSLGARAEVSSIVELMTARRAGVDPENIIFLGPGKSDEELAACLDEGIFAIVCESFEELGRIDELAAERGLTAPVALRVNPSFTTTGAGLTMSGKPRQFGIDGDQLLAATDLVARHPHVRFLGVQVYLGTRILKESDIVDNTARILELAQELSDRLGIALDLVDVGGGLGVAYFAKETDLDHEVLAAGLNPLFAAFADAHPGTRLAMELGRYLAAHSGTYVARVRYVKTSMGEKYAVTDGGTNHHMAAVGIGSFVKRNFPMALLNRIDEDADETWQVCGPLCTPNDQLGKDVPLPAVRPGDLFGVLRSGAYGPTASPGLFLSHGYPAEVLVDEGVDHLVRERDRPADLMRPQRLYKE
ncbi:diaminopimelate decarboxylase [Allocatelliglobosispora scoriae]|uniref:Diaminopimelate decarboxylase n=1 Tax=Allocatelliglobosispora scoriae TaxID=643052 RepID=A0A841C2F0_9ACTN|nr:type III PLP-dependent enzyme [Allocatelliglobosispora scoriae]MBB5874095.1 diaminopimelate decarboxylase [Allocatelliglobosispora scoriae]